ncbi:conserved hypothetical protein [Methanosalsum zhilinae DSM 4017]|uniref:Uncharacterized protein n=1 Tax=Methanosalsum zhilinae (strain DSM 4017 / NBRC 107636 / OCM 62 / WeN5) TaxID=679901 RepID=F7XKQ4_METZD|nr:hypothetical protein [Methanosalsum zhilinae]AEH61767.1 conserved hypothetical protein [Methanosalsum zhilinae DSM 4017]
MGRKFTNKDIEIFNKLAPETGGNTTSAMGHQYPYILRPISHRIAQSSDDFKNRLNKLSSEELDYLVDLALKDMEDIRSLDPGDIDALMDVISEKISSERASELKRHAGII